MTHWPQRQAALLDALAASGALPSDWRPAFEAVPRHQFIPQEVWRQEASCVPVEAGDEWWSLVYSDTPIVTQLDDGRPGGPGIATSSNSKPSLVARMLGALDVTEGHRVLEIGTGTGWNAALLSARLGSRRVTTVEVDQDVAAEAEKAIRSAGYSPRVVHADGEQGFADDAPYNRVIATCSVRRVPPAWIEQTAPGGFILAPLGLDFWSGALLRLRVADGTAQGRAVGGVQFMPMRSHRPAQDAPVDDSTARPSPGALVPETLASLGFALYASARLPGIAMTQGQHDGVPQVWLWDRQGSAATVTDREVWQYGPRDLWDEVTEVHAVYIRAGAPAAEEFGVTVDSGGQRLWLRSPEHPVV
ncbi:methyltransferase domain-containing protein [Streptomyces pactum]|uniref:Protein-L-isoaspartate O-methyltransferase n=1 Tax=Streptomyces pactum TaxID=68249 RepID=A0ABS0NTA7_9ACTN|nr:methyltransferase domain-containing protein [Streptomyces pactum]MBH5338418.1 methyltransferase domain-containing protein [Streptomyces pactum]